MLELKFRIYDLDSKKMYYRTGVTIDQLLEDATDSIWILDANHIKLQYIGIKDKNGVEIFGFDLFHLGDPKILYVVEWQDCGFVGRQISNKSTVGLHHWSPMIELVGNIKENPELMDGS